MRTKRRVFAAQLNVEVLEDRRMLAAAVGSFTRTPLGAHAGGEVFAGAGARAEVPPGPPDAVKLNTKYLWNDVFADTDNVVASIGGGGAFAFGEDRSYAAALTPIGSSTAVPTSVAWSFNKTRVEGGGAEVDITYGSGFSGGGASAVGDYTYSADAQFPDNLYFHGHLFIAANFDPVESGIASVELLDNLLTVNAPSAFAGAHYFGDGYWYWWGDLAGESVGSWSQEGVNVHLVYTIPFTDGQYGEFISQTSAQMSAHATDGFAASLTRLFGASWGYVTAGPDDLTPGDFNYDGDVNSEDFEIWAQGQPQADANLDGKIDSDDFDIWAANATDVVIVSNEIDESDANYSAGDLSLREAIAIAGTDVIVFDPDVNEIILIMGQLELDNDIVIIGTGKDLLTIGTNGNSRAFLVDVGVDATIRNLAIKWGADDYGGGVLTLGNLTLDSVLVQGNTATNDGGGIYAHGTLTLNNSVVEFNTAAANGGGIYVNSPGQAALNDSTIDDNQAYNGGGIYGFLGAGERLEVLNTTISNNEAVGTWASGGGILIQAASSSGPCVATIVNSTISGNTASYSGAARIQGSTAHVDFVNSTIAYNEGNDSGGIHLVSGGTATVNNTIVAENLSGSTDSDVNGALDWANSYFNLIGRGGAYGFSDNDSHDNIVLGSSEDAGLAPLDDYGGSTQTHALLLTSLAIDAGDDAKATAIGLLYDQRGEAYDRIVNRDGVLDPGFDIDIGAFELALSEIHG